MALFILISLVAQPWPERAPDSLGRMVRPLCLDSIIPPHHEPDRWVAMDKFWHFSASFASVGAGYHLCANRARLDAPWPTALSLGGTLGLGISKELLDLRGPSRHFSWKDLVADLAGIALGYFVFIR